MHTNDAASAVTRLIDMGVEPYLVASAVQCFIAQRLVRVICPQCKKSVQLSPEIVTEFGLSEQDITKVTVFEGQGCEACKFTGFRGREGIYEFLILDDDIRQLITARATAGEIKSKAMANGMKPLRLHGWEKILKGITTPSEVIRVSQEELG